MRAAAIIALASVLALTGCEGRKPAEESQRAGVEFQVDRLFTVDGCTVYRFSDNGYLRYFTNCSGSTQWDDTYQCGKSQCKRPQGIQGGGQ